MPDDLPDLELVGELSDAAIEALARLLIDLIDQEDEAKEST